MMTEAQQEQAALYALDLMSAQEAAAFEHELSAHAELQALVRELRDAAAAMALAVPRSVLPSEGLKSRVMDQIAEEAARNEPVNIIRPPRSVFSVVVPWAIAAAFILFCGVLALDRAKLADQLAAEQSAKEDHLAQERSTSEQRLAQERAMFETRLAQERKTFDQRLALENAKMEKRLADERAARAASLPMLIALAPAEGAPAKAQAVVAFDPSTQTGTIKISNLPAAAAGKDYQLWAVDAAHKDPISAGVVRVDANGVAQVQFKPTEAAREVKAFAISLERQGGVPKKEGPILLVGTV